MVSPSTAGRLLPWAMVVMALLLPPAAEAIGLGYIVGIATRVMIFALAGIALNLILGYGGMVSFGHAAFFGAGAYVVGILGQHAAYGEPLMTWPILVEGTDSALIAWPLAMLAAGLLALLIGALSLRTTGLYFIMITLAFAQMIYFFFVSLEAYGGDDGLSLWSRSTTGALGFDLDNDRDFYLMVLSILCLVLFLKRRLIDARFGRVLQGIRDNEQRMRALGFPTFRYKLAAFTLSGTLAGLAGALIANQTEFVSPSFLDWPRSGELIVIVVLGGMGRLYGPLAGAAVFLLLEEVLSAWTPHWMLILGPILVLVVLFARQGICGWFAALGERRDAEAGDG